MFDQQNHHKRKLRQPSETMKEPHEKPKEKDPEHILIQNNLTVVAI